MNLFSSLRFRLRALLRFRRIEDEIAEEIRSHLELATEANIARGLSPAEARTAAERECGRPGQAAEHYRDARGVSTLAGWQMDWRDTTRSLRRAPGFVTLVVLTLALGIGSAAAIFSVIDWALFRPNDFPADVVTVGGLSPEGDFNGARRETFIKAYREQAQSLTDYAFAHPIDVNVAVDGDVVTHGASYITPNALPLLGIAPVMGRGFTNGDTNGAYPTVAIISDYFWRHYFHGASNVIGKTFVVDGNRLCTVVGVLAPGRQLPQELVSDVLLPYNVPPAAHDPHEWHVVWARLKPGVTPANADADLARIWAPLPYELAAYHPYNTPHVVPLTRSTTGTDLRMYWVLVAAIGFIYAIACLNATNLVVGRLLTRRREFSIRLALGGGHWRIVRLLALEVTALTVMAGGVGWLVANSLGPLLLRAMASPPVTHALDVPLAPRALAVLIGVTAMSAIAILFVPAVRILRNDLLPGLRDGGVAIGEGPWLGRIRSAMVVTQAAATVVLLTGAGLMSETLTHLQRVGFGFNPDRLMKLQLAFPVDELPTGVPGLQRLDGVRACLAGVPGVASVSYGSDPIAAGHYYAGIAARAPGTPIVSVETNTFTTEFLRTSGMHLVRGSMFRPDGFGVLINQTLARRMFGDRDPIGQVIHAVDGADIRWPWTVVGIVNDVRDSARSAPTNHIYAAPSWYPPAATTFYVRILGSDYGAMAGMLRHALDRYDSRIVVAYAVPIGEAIGWQSNPERLVQTTLKVLSGLALALTVAGLFSVLTYSVERRMSEFGVRQVLGATARGLAKLVLESSIRLVALGIGIGVIGAMALSRFLRSLLFETRPYDPGVLGFVAATLLIVAIAAGLIPAWRATRTNVSQLLRAE